MLLVLIVLYFTQKITMQGANAYSKDSKAIQRKLKQYWPATPRYQWRL